MESMSWSRRDLLNLCAQYFGNKPQQAPNPNAPSQHGGLQSDVSAPHGAGGGYAPDSAPQAFVNQQARLMVSLEHLTAMHSATPRLF